MSTETKEQEQVKNYVWIKTERAGDTVTVEGTKGEFTLFTDGSKVYTSILNEVLMEAKTEEHALTLAQPFLTPGVNANPTMADSAKASTPSANTESKPEINVMLEMLKKISAKNTISMPLTLNVPSKEVYDLFKDQMDITKADLNEQILALVLSQIDNLQEQLKPQAEEFIKLYYNGRSDKRTKANTGTNSSNSGSNSNAPNIIY